MEQRRYLEDFARKTGVDITTVDSVQGRERDVVILFATKTDSEPDASGFLDAPRRMNVTLTRCRHGQMGKSVIAQPYKGLRDEAETAFTRPPPLAECLKPGAVEPIDGTRQFTNPSDLLLVCHLLLCPVWCCHKDKLLVDTASITFVPPTSFTIHIGGSIPKKTLMISRFRIA
ncbi:hypothetical protein Y032_0551g3324 [Ancylostoma ceylanicum]|nr:hypothetical protein Y032_0551g3324 [Ancylostoma ceylanicum]